MKIHRMRMKLLANHWCDPFVVMPLIHAAPSLLSLGDRRPVDVSRNLLFRPALPMNDSPVVFGEPIGPRKVARK